MRFLSVCSGIEAASVAWQPLGWSAVAFSEIEPFPSAVLAHHYPDIPNWGDMTQYQEWPDAPIDLLCGGTPCQSFSVAGLRKGLADPRGNLMLTFGAIAAKYRPQWLVWENVPGVLSSNKGRDFGAFLGMLGQLGYGFAYRVLDAQYFGVAQRRRRVFVVAHLGDWRRAAAVLFERHSLSGDSAPSREAGEGSSHATASCLTSSGRGVERTGDTRGQDPVVAVHAPAIARCIATREGSSQDWETTTMVTHSLRGEGLDASEDGTGRGTPLVPVAYRVHGEHSVAMTGNGKARVADPVEVARCLDSSGGYATNQGGNVVAHLVPAVLAFHPTQDPISSTDGTTHAMGCGSSGGQASVAVVLDPIRYGDHQQDTLHHESGVMSSLPAGSNNNGGHYTTTVAAMQVRRLTPRECESLQGFPQDYTAIPWRKKPASECPDGPRYKALGNSWAVPVARWIGKRIEQQMKGNK